MHICRELKREKNLQREERMRLQHKRMEGMGTRTTESYTPKCKHYPELEVYGINLSDTKYQANLSDTTSKINREKEAGMRDHKSYTVCSIYMKCPERANLQRACISGQLRLGVVCITVHN